VARKEKLRVKKPRPPKQPRLRSKTFWLEVLFFVALAVFGFSLVAYWLGGQQNLIVRFAQVTGGKPASQAPMLYEAPSRRPRPEPALSPIFTRSVQYWEDDLLKWAEEYSLDPNLIATVMQIESCGNPNVSSWVGATGLFQVMPFHFDEGEDAFDPDTNAKRGMLFLAEGLRVSGGHAGLAMAGYNGGHSLITRPYEDWPRETQRYYRWGSGIYREASAGWDSSPTLEAWLAAGGQSLCDQAVQQLGL
jgi:soluble lytic murein transglycosylase-like protein